MSSAKTDVDEFIRLIAHCRDNGYRIGSVRLGSLQLEIEDLRLDAREGLKPQEYQPRNIWRDAGFDGELPGDGTVGQ
jgi:hypothetical protein